MNLKKIKTLIEKIQLLQKGMDVSGNKISNVEKDLMLSYIRELYEAALETKQTESSIEPETKNIQPEPEPKSVEIKSEERQETTEPEIIETEDSKEVEVPESDPEQQTPSKNTASEPQKEEIEIEPEIEDPMENIDLEALFEEKKGKELSDKLASMPIKNLSKSMGINEKFFTINELFGGKPDLFSETVKNLDSMESFEAAKAYLITHVAQEESWSSESKKKKAEQFIKLVRRRYN